MPGPVGKLSSAIGASRLLPVTVLILGWLRLLGPAAAADAPQTKDATQPATEDAKTRARAQGELDRIRALGPKLAAEGKLAEAIAAGEKAVGLIRVIEGANAESVADWQAWLALLHEKRDEWAAARTCCDEALAIRKKLYGDKDWSVTDARLALHDLEILSRLTAEQRRELSKAEAVSSQVEVLFAKDDYRGAIPLAERAAEIRRRILGTDNRETATSLFIVANLYRLMSNLPKATPLYRQVLEVRIKLLGEKHPDTATSLNNLALAHDSQGEYAKAEPRYQQALKISQEVLGAKDAFTATCLSNLGVLYKTTGKYTKAEPLLRQALEIRKQTQGEQHPDTARTIDYLATLYQAMGNYPKAEPLFRQALDLRQKGLTAKHPDTAISFNNLGWQYYLTAEYSKAEPLLLKALEINTQALGEYNTRTADNVNNLAVLYQATGAYGKAEPLFQRALEIHRKAHGELHPLTATSLNNLGEFYRALDEFAKAEPLFRESLEIKRKVLGAAHPDTATSQSSLASLYASMGDYGKAELLERQVLDIRKKTLGEEHPDTATAFNNLAALYKETREYRKAEPLYRQAIAMYRKTVGENHVNTARSLDGLATVYDSMGDYAQAEPLYREALDIRKKVLPQSHRDTALNLNNLANLHFLKGDYREAESMYRQAFDMFRNVLGDSHPLTGLSQQNLALLYWSTGDLSRAEALARGSLAVYERHFANSLATRSERRQLALAKQLRLNLDAYLTVSPKIPANEVYRHVLKWKGAVFMRQHSDRIARRRPDLQPAFRELDAVGARLSTLALRGPDAQGRTVWERQLAELNDRKETLETDLSGKSTDFRGEQTLLQMTPGDLQGLLPAGAVLVDFLEYSCSVPETGKHGPLKKERRLVAFVVRRDRPIARVELGSIEPVTAAVESWRRDIVREAGAAEEVSPGTDPSRKPPQQIVKELLWHPLEKHLDESQIVLISPDGVLSQVPLAALPGQKPGSYLLEDKALAVVPVPRLLPQLLQASQQHTTAEKAAARSAGEQSLLVIGDVTYGGSPGRSEAVQVVTRSAACGSRGGTLHFRDLEYTRSEMATIRDSFEKNFPDAKAKSLRGDRATESAFRQEAPKYRWLHRATHGFFAPPQIASALAPSQDEKDRGFEEFSREGISGYHPGLLSGLALSGANTLPRDNEDDGILTAVEVAGLDLEHAELVVLSACETGLGSIAGGEGVLGLQRAFQLAGARTTVASLWKVPDRATMQLMQRFYENLWDKKMTKIEALRDAQLWMLKEGRRRGLDLEENGAKKLKSTRLLPLYWAGFVLSSDWR